MIDIVNSDPVLHNTHGYYGKRTAFNVALPIQGGRVTQAAAARPGVVRVDCDAHGWMVGWIYVAETRTTRRPATDGTFSISDVPPGSYTLVVSQDYTGDTEMPVTVKAKATVAGPDRAEEVQPRSAAADARCIDRTQEAFAAHDVDDPDYAPESQEATCSRPRASATEDAATPG